MSSELLTDIVFTNQADGGITAKKLNLAWTDATIQPAFISDKTAVSTYGPNDYLILLQAAGTYAKIPASAVGSSSGGVSAMQWVPYTGPPQSFQAQQTTRDGDWTMVAKTATTDRPAPQPSGAEEDLLPAWTPAIQNARASYTLYNEWTLSSAGWVEQYGIDVLAQNVGAQHVITLTVGGTVKDTFTTTPNAAELYWHNITPLVVTSGTVIRVTLQVTQVSNNAMYWLQQALLFATAPIYCSLAVGSKDGAAAGTTAYGTHLLFTPGAASPNWDILAFSGAAAAGGGGGVSSGSWTALSYATGWSEGTVARYRIETNGAFVKVIAEGIIAYAAGAASLAFTLPAGAQPSVQRGCALAGYDSSGDVQLFQAVIATSGAVNIYPIARQAFVWPSATNGNVYLDNLTFAI
jgi:hypothetical protein